MNKTRLIHVEILSFLSFYVVYGFCIGFLVYLALTSETVGLGRSESFRYAILSALIIAPIVYLGVQISEKKEQNQKGLQEKLRVEIKKSVEHRKD